jgi:hypothetical protein
MIRINSKTIESFDQFSQLSMLAEQLRNDLVHAILRYLWSGVVRETPLSQMLPQRLHGRGFVAPSPQQ